MLEIREQQVSALSVDLRRRFERRMMNHLRADFPEPTRDLDERALRNLIAQGVDRAEAYGIEYEEDIQRFLEYMMVLSQDFDTSPTTAWAGDVLRDVDLDGAQKIGRIDDLYIFSQQGQG